MELQTILSNLINKQNLTVEQSSELMEEMVRGSVTPSQIAAVLMALRMKGETADEILGFITVMRRHMQQINTSGTIIDTCGTGGDGSGTFNISTCTALVVAAAGVKVAKHGNRAASSRCGSADVLEALGVRIDLTSLQAEKLLQKTNFTFLFAPLYHPSVKYVVPIRKELKVRTIFNYLGPFLNSAGTKRQIIGVPTTHIAKLLSRVATELGYEHLLIVTSEDGLDEISLGGKTTVFEIKGTKCTTYDIHPSQFGIKTAAKETIKGGDVSHNAEIIRRILEGENSPYKDAVIINSSAALYIARVTKDMFSGAKLIRQTIDSGKAYQLLQHIIKVSQNYE